MSTAQQYTLAEAVSTCLTMCQRCLLEIRTLARVPGPAGPPGPAGRNAADLKLLQEYIDQCVGITLKNASVTTQDGGRTLLWSVGGTVREVQTAIVLDAGVWTQREYAAGDGVSLDGSFWIAQKQTSSRPPSDDWRLAVKRGRDGKDHRPDDPAPVKPIRFK